MPFTAVNLILDYNWALAYPLKHQTGTSHGLLKYYLHVRHHYHSTTRCRALVNQVSGLPPRTHSGLKHVSNGICSLSSWVRLRASICFNGRTKGNKWAGRLFPLSALVPRTLGNLPGIVLVQASNFFFPPAEHMLASTAFMTLAGHGGDNPKLFRERKAGINVLLELLDTPLTPAICPSNS